MVCTRTGWLVGLGAGVVAATLGGCKKPPATLPALRPGWKEIARFKYQPETLAQGAREAGFGVLAEEMAESKDPVEGRYAAKDSLEIKDDADAPIEEQWYPQNKMIDVEIPTRNQGAAWCKFRVIMGPAAGALAGSGKRVEADGEPHADKGEPIYAAEEGYIVVGGHIPVARGRRSRAGAPGTIIALWVVPGAKAGEYTDRWFIVNWKGTHKLDVAPRTTGAAQSERITVDAAKDTKIAYVEVDNDGKLTKKEFTKGDANDAVYKFWINAQNIARRTGLDNVKW